MNALALIPSNGSPPARQGLVVLNDRIAAAERQLDRLVRGRDQLRAELSRADSARNELDSLVMEDASSLAQKLRSGASWALSHFGSARAMNLVAALSESRVQQEVGNKALASVTEEIAVLEREVADLQAAKQDAIRGVLVEVASGYRSDLNAIADELRQTLSILGGLDKITAKPTGEWIPDRDQRIAVTLPAIGGVREQVVVAPASTIDRAQAIWRDFAAELDSDPFTTVETLVFPHVSGSEDSSTTVYADYSSAERHQIDLERASGAKQ